ncbi:CopG family transcriptional regulator [Ramlibacter sp.]|uniref:CopG family transcriptional regulator n=1 Tax=Ramlibacter sp. TaxID=1917967 RepID=UPI002D672CD2|nr:CopG family transcriptional regulator [Ramlibacter sp.]HYD76919.1 CopG family transcriptional regulator [Ramlibacter sp.]
MENKTARLTVLIDPARKAAFEKLCYSQDMTPSQVMRRLVREFMEQHEAAPRPAAVRKTAVRRR